MIAARRSERGAVAVLVALLSIVMFAMAAIAVDLSNTFVRKRDVQRQADFAALAGGSELGSQTSGAVPAVVVDAVRDQLNGDSVVSNLPQDDKAGGATPVTSSDLTDTDLTNGAIDVLPGTQQRFYKFWQYALRRKYRDSTRICMEQGDVLLRVSTMWHRGMPNHSADPRPMMSITFGEVSAPESNPFGTNDGQPLFYPNWYGTDRLSLLRERAFVRAPWLYSTLRFGRSLVGNKGYSSW